MDAIMKRLDKTEAQQKAQLELNKSFAHSALQFDFVDKKAGVGALKAEERKAKDRDAKDRNAPEKGEQGRIAGS